MPDSPLPPYIEELNPDQKAAALHGGAPLLILAGAGSGKTRVITTKIAYLVDHENISPRSILAVTFTNKAAAQMRERALALTGEAGDAMIRTFHSFGAWILRRHAGAAGLSSTFSIYDDEDSLSLLSLALPGREKPKLSLLAREISRAKDYALGPEDDLGGITGDPEFAGAYRSYEEKLSQAGNVDFGDLILKPLKLFREHPEIKSRLRDRFKVILVDEYQDSNVAQFELLKQLTGKDTYLCVVGDDDQSIYGFRGAEVKNILTFGDSFPGAQVIRLEQNYRSTGEILKAAGAVVAHNRRRLGKTLWTANPPGRKPAFYYLADHEEEAKFCLSLLAEGNGEGTAILYRTNAQSAHFETLFTRRRVPYRIVGARRFYEREEVKDVIAYLRLFNNPGDEVSFRRIINKPKRGLGEQGVERIAGAGPPGRSPADFWEAAGEVLKGAGPGKGRLSPNARKGLEEFLALRESLGEFRERPLQEFVEQLIRRSGLLELYKDRDSIIAQQKQQNLEQMVNAARDYGPGPGGLTAYLEDMNLDNSLGEEALKRGDTPGVTLITMHNTKGLEFDRVIITGLEEGLFPSRRNGGEDEEEKEEERRIFYVSLTRARRELYLTACRRRLIWGRWVGFSPSSFLNELGPENLELHGAPVLQAGGGTGDGRGGWPPGTGVFHGDYGPGVVVKEWHNGRDLLVLVAFDSGKTGQFIPRYTPLERIARD